MVAEMSSDSCLTCRFNRDEIASLGGPIYRDALWRLEHVNEPIPLVGWLVLKPMRYVEAFADLTEEEAAAFGPLTRRVTQAMTEVLRPIKTYLSLFTDRAPTRHRPG